MSCTTAGNAQILSLAMDSLFQMSCSSQTHDSSILMQMSWILDMTFIDESLQSSLSELIAKILQNMTKQQACLCIYSRLLMLKHWMLCERRLSQNCLIPKSTRHWVFLYRRVTPLLKDWARSNGYRNNQTVRRFSGRLEIRRRLLLLRKILLWRTQTISLKSDIVNLILNSCTKYLWFFQQTNLHKTGFFQSSQKKDSTTQLCLRSKHSIEKTSTLRLCIKCSVYRENRER